MIPAYVTAVSTVLHGFALLLQWIKGGNLKMKKRQFCLKKLVPQFQNSKNKRRLSQCLWKRYFKCKLFFSSFLSVRLTLSFYPLSLAVAPTLPSLRSEVFKPCVEDKDLAFCLNEGECSIIETVAGVHRHCR